MDRPEHTSQDRKRDAIVTTNIGVSAGATSGITATAGVMASNSTAATTAAPVMASSAAGGGVKLPAAGIGMAVTGGLIVVGGLLVGGPGGSAAEAPLVTQPMDESILEFEFAGTEFDSGYSAPTTLFTEQEMRDGELEIDPGVDSLPQFLVGEPQYGDFDGDNDMDAVHQVAPYAGGATPALYVWLWEDGEVVQVPHAAAMTEDCGDHIDSFSVVDDRIQVDMTTGWWCTGESDPTPVTFTVVIEDGFPVQIDPGYGAVKQCEGDAYEVLDEPSDIGLYVARSPDAPQLDPTEYERIELLNWGSPDLEWKLVRTTGSDGTINCAWTTTW